MLLSPHMFGSVLHYGCSITATVAHKERGVKMTLTIKKAYILFHLWIIKVLKIIIQWGYSTKSHVLSLRKRMKNVKQKVDMAEHNGEKYACLLLTTFLRTWPQVSWEQTGAARQVFLCLCLDIHKAIHHRISLPNFSRTFILWFVSPHSVEGVQSQDIKPTGL